MVRPLDSVAVDHVITDPRYILFSTPITAHLFCLMFIA